MLACVRANVRVRLAGSGRLHLECTAGRPVVYMGRSKKGETKSVRGKDFVSCLDKLAGQLGCIYVYRITQAVSWSLVWSCALGLGHGKVV